MHVRTIVGQPAFLYSIAGLRVCQKNHSPTYPQTIQCYLLIVCAPKVTLLRPTGKDVSGVAVVKKPETLKSQPEHRGVIFLGSPWRYLGLPELPEAP